jgi:capping protein beta
MRRLPPQKVEDNTSKLTQILPELTDDILESIDQPLIIAKCTKTGKHYLQADFNRVGDSYRSPWSNEYEPSIQDADFPNTKLRQLEVTANQAFDTYREL